MESVRTAGRIVYGLLLLAIGALLALGGAKLIWLGGSWYYLPAGLMALLAGYNVLKRNWWTGAAIYGVLLAVTLVWALCEVGLDGWQLMPRVVSPLVLGLPFLIVALTSRIKADRQGGWLVVGTAAVLALAVWASSGFTPAPARSQQPAVAADAPGDWLNFGNDRGGMHFSPLGDIGRDNVGKLKAAWTVPLGPMPPKPAGQIDATPLKVGDHVYVCTPFNDVLDIDATSGKVRWSFKPERNNSGISVVRCRGVAYYEVPGATGLCSKRVYTAVSDGASLYALDAETGAVCSSFGESGRADLLRGIKQREAGYYNVSSAPTLIKGKLVFGGVVADGQHVGEPSGVVRAYDAVTGKLAWAWDMGRPGQHGLPAEGEYYTPGTPNAWGPMSSDEELGIVYVPTGNSTPDYWGGHRSPESNTYTSSLVALDGNTGEPRWHFQTTHYDVWDLDIASKPVLFTLRKDGKTTPAVIIPTKRGELFVLDRRTGTPLFPVEEKPAPQRGAVEKLSPTQPWSTSFPSLMGPLLNEKRMWGVSALDQLWCRLRYKEARYDGALTPPGIDWWIQDPGYVGGVDWGSASVDESRQLAFIVSSRMVNRNRLIPRSEPEGRDAKANVSGEHGRFVAQEGTPFAAAINPFMSPLGIPCQAPPYGLLNAIDLTTGKMVWERPLGTARDLGIDPSGHRQPYKSRLPFVIGTPNFGGTLSTASGLTFVAASTDHAFRAFDAETGKLLFETDLPGNGTATPMSYRGSDGRQYVAIVSEAPTKDGQVWGAVTAFALPK
jgi:quinoprotein glucose dehydrogenase